MALTTRGLMLPFAVVSRALIAPSLAPAQQLAGWAGSVRCELQAQAEGYSHQETQVWTLTGAAPTVQGSITVYPATWSVTGQGSHDRSRYTNRRVAQWTAAVPGSNSPVSAPIGFIRHPVGGTFDVAKWHAQLTASGGYTGTDQYINDGVAQPAGRLAMTVYEWQFPRIPAAVTDTQLTGVQSSEVRAFVGPLQPGEAQATVTCAWALGRGLTPPLPPPTIQPPVVVAGGTPSGGTGTAPPTSGNPAAPVTPPSPPPASAPGGSPAAPNAPAPGGPGVLSPSSPTNSIPGARPPGGLTAVPNAGGVTASTATDPANFVAKQTADGTVLLSWDPVPGAGSYMLGGPGTSAGVMVTGTTHTVSGISPGTHTWVVATNYSPGGVLTTADKWPKATETVVNNSGRYRIVLNGFRVHNETNAGTFGEHNAVFAAAAIGVLNRQDNLAMIQGPTTIRTLVHGDTQREPNRVMAGTASPTGGLLAGDMVPATANPATSAVTSLAPSPTTFPFLLWEGQLSNGREAVVIRPTLWVRNGRLDTFETWRGKVTSSAAYGGQWFLDPISRADLSLFRAGDMFLCFADTEAIPYVTPMKCASGSDRPIGLQPHSNAALSHQNAWHDLIVVITREAIEKALASASQVGGIAPGVIPIPLADHGPTWGGNYDLYLRVERLP